MPTYLKFQKAFFVKTLADGSRGHKIIIRDYCIWIILYLVLAINV